MSLHADKCILGVISLGITVAQGLINYYNSWKDAPSDVATTIKSLDNLVKILAHIKASRELRGKSSSTAQLDESIKQCESGIQKLQQKLQKVEQVSNASTSAIKQKMKTHYLRALYPFKESTLAKLREIV